MASPKAKATVSQVTYNLRAAACRLGSSAMSLADVAARYRESKGELVLHSDFPNLKPAVMTTTQALRRASLKLEASAIRMKLLAGRHAEEDRVRGAK